MDRVEPKRKVCTGCDNFKQPEAFAADRRHSDGLQSQCRQCTKDRQKRERQEQPERVKARKAAEYIRNKPVVAAAQRRYREANRERLNEYQKLHTQDPRVREQRREASRRYREANPEVCADRVRNWGRANPGKRVDYTNRRRARKRSQPWDKIDPILLAIRDRWICGICGMAIDPSARFPNHESRSVDHIVPLSLNGGHVWNNVRITHLICNIRRGAARDEEKTA